MPSSYAAPTASGPPPETPLATIESFRNPEFTDIWFADSDSGWLIGHVCPAEAAIPHGPTAAPQPQRCDGLIEGTTDGGQTWAQLYRGDFQPQAIQFIDARTGWISGRVGHECVDFSAPCDSTVLRSTDGGKTWSEVYRSAFLLSGAVFISPLDGWLLTQDCPSTFNLAERCATFIVTTRDGGLTWNAPVSAPASHRAMQLSRPTANDAWIASGDDVSDAQLLVTHDGGKSWEELNAPGGAGPGRINFFRDGSLGWQLTGGMPGTGMERKALYRTNDGGQSWTLLADATFEQIGYPADAGLPEIGGLTLAGYIGGLVFTSTAEGWLASPRAGLLHTSDGGRHWSTAVVYAEGGPSAVQFPTPQRGFFLTTQGIWRTADGGVSWTRLPLP